MSVVAFRAMLDYTRYMGRILRELAGHLPFSVAGVAVGVALVWTLQGVAASGNDPLWAFHPLHSVHVLLSAAATAAVFRGRGGTAVRSAAVGAVGALGVCAVSDVFLPHLSSLLMGSSIRMHVCLLEEPALVLSFCAAGLAAGIAAASATKLAGLASHTLHVVVSAGASAWYIAAAVGDGWLGVPAFLFVLAAVALPCCLSDIVFPMCVPCRTCRAVSPCSEHRDQLL